MAVKFPDIIKVEPSAQWATMCPARNPKFKVHATKALALAAITYKKPDYDIALYKLTGEGWKREWEYLVPDNCQWCGGPFEGKRGWKYRYIEPVRKAKWAAAVICEKCAYMEDE